MIGSDHEESLNLSIELRDRAIITLHLRNVQTNLQIIFYGVSSCHGHAPGRFDTRHQKCRCHQAITVWSIAQHFRPTIGFQLPIKCDPPPSHPQCTNLNFSATPTKYRIQHVHATKNSSQSAFPLIILQYARTEVASSVRS